MDCFFVGRLVLEYSIFKTVVPAIIEGESADFVGGIGYPTGIGSR